MKRQVGWSYRSGVEELQDFLQYFLLDLVHNDPVFAGQNVAVLVIVVVVHLSLDVVRDHRGEDSRGLCQFVFVSLVLTGSRQQEEVRRLLATVGQIGLTCGAR